MSGAGLALGTVGALALATALRRRGSRAEVKQAVWRQGARFDAEAPWEVGQRPLGPVLFDPKDGIGRIGYTTNIDYLGFLVWMKPSEYLALNPVLDMVVGYRERIAWFVDNMRAGEAFGPPWLGLQPMEYADVDGKQDVPVSFRVVNHEGRHRTTALRRIVGDVEFPVYCTTNDGSRARHLSARALLGAEVKADKRSKVGFFDESFVIRRFALEGVCYGERS